MSDHAAIRARVEAARPGPWYLRREKFPTSDSCDVVSDRHSLIAQISWTSRLTRQDEADAEFIAHARSDVPALLDEVERLRADLSRAAERDEAAAVLNALTGQDIAPC